LGLGGTVAQRRDRLVVDLEGLERSGRTDWMVIGVRERVQRETDRLGGLVG